MIWHETPLTVRFNEVDSYQVAWHGHFVAWMEVGRNNLAGEFGLNAEQIGTAGFRAPVVNLELAYIRPARFNERLIIATSARRTETATLEFPCRIIGENGAVIAEGATIHVLTDTDGILQYHLPPVIAERLERLLASLETP
jgi:acyl-CoA thioester hydrolase